MVPASVRQLELIADDFFSVVAFAQSGSSLGLWDQTSCVPVHRMVSASSSYRSIACSTNVQSTTWSAAEIGRPAKKTKTRSTKAHKKDIVSAFCDVNNCLLNRVKMLTKFCCWSPKYNREQSLSHWNQFSCLVLRRLSQNAQTKPISNQFWWR